MTNLSHYVNNYDSLKTKYACQNTQQHNFTHNKVLVDGKQY